MKSKELGYLAIGALFLYAISQKKKAEAIVESVKPQEGDSVFRPILKGLEVVTK